jgi:hypothetical protein
MSYDERRASMTPDQLRRSDEMARDLAGPGPGSFGSGGPRYDGRGRDYPEDIEDASASQPSSAEGRGQGLAWSLSARERERRAMFEKLSEETGIPVSELMW